MSLYSPSLDIDPPLDGDTVDRDPLPPPPLDREPPLDRHAVAATAAVGTHPTGMHSRFEFNFLKE